MAFDDNSSQEHQHGLRNLPRSFTCTWPLAATCSTDTNMDLVVIEVININMSPPRTSTTVKPWTQTWPSEKRDIIFTFLFPQEVLAWEQLKPIHLLCTSVTFNIRKHKPSELQGLLSDFHLSFFITAFLTFYCDVMCSCFPIIN